MIIPVGRASFCEQLIEATTYCGHFKLANSHSDRFMDVPSFWENPHALDRTVSELTRAIPSSMEFDFVIGVPSGAWPLVYPLATKLTKRQGGSREVSYGMAKKVGSDFLIPRRLKTKLRQQKGKILLVDDVTTTSGSIIKILEILPEDTATATAVIVNRSGTESIRGLPLFSVCQTQIESWAAEDCPLCQQGIPITPKP